MASFFFVMIAVFAIMLSVFKKMAQNEADSKKANQKIDGMTADELRQAAFGPQNNKNNKPQTPVKKQMQSLFAGTIDETKKASTKTTEKSAAKKSAPRKKDKSLEYFNRPENKKVEEDILTRSVNNAREDFNDDSIKESADKHEACSAPHFEESEDLYKTVRDLMVFGPNCKMSYERDFIAEGERMIELQKG